jgi:hypothetical protein
MRHVKQASSVFRLLPGVGPKLYLPKNLLVSKLKEAYADFEEFKVVKMN